MTNIWTWSLLGFAVIHILGGVIAWINFRHQKYTWTFPVVFTFLGMLIPLTAGIITGECMHVWRDRMVVRWWVGGRGILGGADRICSRERGLGGGYIVPFFLVAVL